MVERNTERLIMKYLATHTRTFVLFGCILGILSSPEDIRYDCAINHSPCGTSSASLAVPWLYYYRAVDDYHFTQCDAFGGCFTRPCGPRTVWKQSYRTCVNTRFVCNELRVTDTGSDTVYKVDLADLSVTDLNVSPISSFNPYGVDVDSRLGLMFVISGARLFVGGLDGTNMELMHDFVHSSGTNIRSIAVDPTQRRIYFTDRFTPDRLGYITYPIPVVTDLNLNPAVTLNSPQGIELDIVNQQVYWTDAGSPEYIARADYDGQNTEQILDDSDLANNFDLTLDFEDNKVYWADTDRIESMNLDGTDRQLVLTDPGADFHGIELVGGHLYVADSTAGVIKQVSKSGVILSVIGSGAFSQPRYIAAVCQYTDM